MLILASTSAYRRALVERLSVPFRCVAPDVDEAAAKRGSPDPRATAELLARSKAQDVAARHPDAIVVGSDQVASIAGCILDKPGDRARAIEQLRRLRGGTHELLTAVAIAHPGGLIEFCDRTVLTMRDLDDAAIERYVDADQPFDCAGSYKIEALGITLFERVASDDQTAIQGLPLMQICRELRQLGIALP